MKKIFHSISIVSTLFLLSACSNTPTVIATTIKNLTGCENVDVKKNYPNYAFTKTQSAYPEVPMMAIRKGIKESYVIFDFDISVNGEPTNIRLKEAYPSDIFVSNAEKALKQTKYEPRLENGMPIETTCANVQFDYTISDKVIRM